MILDCPVCGSKSSLELDPRSSTGVRVRNTCGRRHAAVILAAAQCLPSDGQSPADMLRSLVADMGGEDAFLSDPDCAAFLAASLAAPSR